MGYSEPLNRSIITVLKGLEKSIHESHQQKRRAKGRDGDAKRALENEHLRKKIGSKFVTVTGHKAELQHNLREEAKSPQGI